jgi:pimeloyl-ACP methyl ester carboxylesterase
MSASIHQESTPVIALHCSLGSGRQWTRLSEALGRGFEVIAPDLSGYGKNIARTMLPTTLADEVALLDEQLDRVKGAVHLVGHSYGGAVAFKMATSARWASRIRSLTLIEPVLPTLLRDNAADIRLHDVFADMGTRLSVDLWNGMDMEALDRFLDFWNGSAPRTGQRSSQGEALNAEARLRMIEVIEKVPYDFTAILAEADVAQAAHLLRVPTLLVSGGLSPYMTQRIVTKLAALIPGAEMRHLPAAGHMLPITHAKMINPEIAGHIELADDFASVLLAAPPAAAGLARSNRPQLRLIPG